MQSSLVSIQFEELKKVFRPTHTGKTGSGKGKQKYNFFLRLALPYFTLQTEEEREWFAQRFESKDKIDISNGRKISLATLLLRAEVRGTLS